MYCDSLLQCSQELSKLDAATRDNITWLHVVSYPFGWKRYKKESKALQDAGIFLSSEREVMNDSTWDKHENEMLLQSHAREVYYSDPRSIVVAQSDGCAAKLRWLGARLASPPQSVYDAFESRNNGKRGTARWLRAHGLGRFAIREFDVAQLWRNPENATFPLMLKPYLCSADVEAETRSEGVLKRMCALDGLSPTPCLCCATCADPTLPGIAVCGLRVAATPVLACARCWRIDSVSADGAPTSGRVGPARACCCCAAGRATVASAPMAAVALLGLAAAAVGERPSEAECQALGFATPSLLCSSCEKLGEFVGIDDPLISECERCCTAAEASTSSYTSATLDVCK